MTKLLVFFDMLTSLFRRLLRRLFHRAPPTGRHPATPSTAIETLNQQAPLRQQLPQAGLSETSETYGLGATVLCREPILDRQQKITGYQFMLQEAVHANIRPQSRRILHLYSEILIQQLLQANIGTLLGHRIAFIEIPDSFLDHPNLTRLLPKNTFFILKPVEDANAPSPEALLGQVQALRAHGYRIGIPDPVSIPAYLRLLPEIDLVFIQAPQIDIERALNLARYILKEAPRAALLVRDLPAIEDFNFCFKIGGTLFQGPFVTSRERWQEGELGPNFARLSMLLSKLRQDADTREIVVLLKQDVAITLRLLRYINSAANGLRERVSSIEHALVMLGRGPLQRWLMLLLCSSNRNQPRAGAVLETALVRARTMELVSTSRTPPERETIFLTGLLSLIDVILQQPIEHALEVLAIDTDIRNAILSDSGPYAPALALARACESMDARRIVSAAEACGIDPEQASIRYMDALAWTLTLQRESND